MKIMSRITWLWLLLLTVCAVDVSAQEPPQFRLIIQRNLHDLEWSPDGSALAVALDTEIVVYDAALQEIVVLEGHTGEVTAVAWSPDGSTLLTGGGSGDGTIRIWSRTDSELTFYAVFWSRHDVVLSLNWSPTGDKLAALVQDDIGGFNGVAGAVQIWSTEDWTLEREIIQINDPAGNLAWSPDGTLLAGAGSFHCPNENPGCALRNGIFIADVETGELVAEVDLPLFSPYWLAWSVNNQIAAAEGHVTLYNAELQDRRELDVSYEILEWSRDGSKLAGIDSMGLVEIMDVETNSVLYSNYGAPGFITFDWSPNENTIATGRSTGTIELWEVGNFIDVETGS